MWIRRHVDSEAVYNAFLAELRQARIRKGELTNSWFEFQGFDGYGTGRHGQFGRNGAWLTDAWYQGFSVPREFAERGIELFVEAAKQFGSYFLRSVEDAVVAQNGYLLTRDSDYPGMWPLAGAEGNRSIDVSVLGQMLAAAKQAVETLEAGRPLDITLSPYHLVHPPLTLYSTKAYTGEQAHLIDQINSYRCRLVRLLAWPMHYGLAKMWQQTISKPATFGSAGYLANSEVPYNLPRELGCYIQEMEEHYPLLVRDAFPELRRGR